MKPVLKYGFLATAVLSLLFVTLPAQGLLNPHIKPEPCGSCHTQVPTEEDGRNGDYYLLKDSIDDTCHVCHELTCCMPGNQHGGNHPSNIKDWDWDKFRRPKTLPLFAGYITCSTCHLHGKPDGPSYKLVRIVKIDGKKIDWSQICTDCHVGY
jgi:hypothetical protein